MTPPHPPNAEQMFGVFLLVYVRPRLAPHVRGVHAEVVKTGFGSESLGVKAGNKGGLAVRLDIYGASLCIINSHLPAGQSHPEERNTTYHEVLRGLASGFAASRGGAVRRRHVAPASPPRRTPPRAGLSAHAAAQAALRVFIQPSARPAPPRPAVLHRSA